MNKLWVALTAGALALGHHAGDEIATDAPFPGNRHVSAIAQ